MTRDLRKDEPYLAYRDFDFKVCCAEAGDCYARYLVRMAEMRESLKIVDQAIENLPAGPVNVGDRRSARSCPTSGMVFSTIEGLISHFELVMTNRGFQAPCEEVYCGHRGAERRAGLLPRRRRHATRPIAPAAARRRSSTSPCFPHLIRGHTLSDVVAVLGSLNIIAAELDR